MSQTKDDRWGVYDMNQRGAAPRVHEIGEVSYPLFREKPCLMPVEHAVFFLRDPAFKVVNADGVQQTSLPSETNADGKKRAPELEPNETIAKFEELLKPALLARAKIRPGGEALTDDASRDELIAFLMNAPLQRDLPEHEKPRATDGNFEIPADDRVPDEALNKMLDPGRMLEGA